MYLYEYLCLCFYLCIPCEYLLLGFYLSVCLSICIWVYLSKYLHLCFEPVCSSVIPVPWLQCVPLKSSVPVLLAVCTSICTCTCLCTCMYLFEYCLPLVFTSVTTCTSVFTCVYLYSPGHSLVDRCQGHSLLSHCPTPPHSPPNQTRPLTRLPHLRHHLECKYKSL